MSGTDSQAVRCLVVGAGDMGRAHAQALDAIAPGACAVYAPSARNAEAVEALGIPFHSGDLGAALSEFGPSHAVVASPVDALAEQTLRLVGSGVRSVLVEKPAALDLQSGRKVSEAAARHDARVWVGYNRRFYASVRTARRMMADAGESPASVSFEFTEWAHVIEGLTNQSETTKSRWLLANSMHVIDAALHPVGLPDPERSGLYCSGGLRWHPASSIFVGAGFSNSGVPFSYSADWGSPGRWGFEWLTPSMRYIFRPLEKLHVVRRGTVAVEELPLDDDLDDRFKPGVYEQDRRLLQDDPHGDLVSLEEALGLVALGQEMAGYPRG